MNFAPSNQTTQRDSNTLNANPNSEIENRFRYKVDETRVNFNDKLAHNRQIDEYRNKQRQKAWD